GVTAAGLPFRGALSVRHGTMHQRAAAVVGTRRRSLVTLYPGAACAACRRARLVAASQPAARATRRADRALIERLLTGPSEVSGGPTGGAGGAARIAGPRRRFGRNESEGGGSGDDGNNQVPHGSPHL